MELSRVFQSEKWRRAKQMKLLYLLLIVPVLLIFVFKYVPMYGVIIAFKDFRMADGITGSEWNQFRHFRILFDSPGFYRVLKNTLVISSLKLLFGIPAPIIFALLLNELKAMMFKKVVQTVSYLPYFMSWVILGGIVTEILSPQRGIVNKLLMLVGLDPVHFLASPFYFVPILIITAVWQSVGWGAIIYLAGLSSVDPGLYESADMDGANRWQKAVYISIPSLIPIIVILSILSLGNILEAGFDQIFNLYNPLVYSVADILDTYIYRTGLLEAKYDYGAAIGLFQTVVGVILIVITNVIVRKYSEYGLW